MLRCHASIKRQSKLRARAEHRSILAVKPQIAKYETQIPSHYVTDREPAVQRQFLSLLVSIPADSDEVPGGASCRGRLLGAGGASGGPGLSTTAVSPGFLFLLGERVARPFARVGLTLAQYTFLAATRTVDARMMGSGNRLHSLVTTRSSQPKDSRLLAWDRLAQ